MLDAECARRRWQRSQRITAALLAVWFGVSFVATFFARDLSPAASSSSFSFWLAAQGAPLVYLVLAWLYARLTHRLDTACGATQDD